MEKTSLSRLALGVGIIALGVAALLGSLNLINFKDIFSTFWPLLLISAGLVLALENLRQNYIWAAVLILFGTTAQLNTLGIADMNFWELFWPVVLIAIGWSVLSQRTKFNSLGTDNVSAILSGAETKNHSQDYQGGKATAVLGGCSIDLTKANIKKEATLEVLAIMGGVELRVPENWEVKVSIMSILGGAENKTISPQSSSKTKPPVLNVVGTAVMGGIEIKN